MPRHKSKYTPAVALERANGDHPRFVSHLGDARFEPLARFAFLPVVTLRDGIVIAHDLSVAQGFLTLHRTELHVVERVEREDNDVRVYTRSGACLHYEAKVGRKDMLATVLGEVA